MFSFAKCIFQNLFCKYNVRLVWKLWKIQKSIKEKNIKIYIIPDGGITALCLSSLFPQYLYNKWYPTVHIILNSLRTSGWLIPWSVQLLILGSWVRALPWMWRSHRQKTYFLLTGLGDMSHINKYSWVISLQLHSTASDNEPWFTHSVFWSWTCMCFQWFAHNY